MKEKTVSEEINTIIKTHGGWRGEMISELRAIIKKADPEVTEEVKWKMPSKPEGVPVWSHGEVLCIAETFKDKVALTFFKGAELKDPHKLFNSRLKSKTDRAIDFHKGDEIKKTALKELISEAVKLNKAKESDK